MSLTKQDLSDVRQVVKEVVDSSLEDKVQPMIKAAVEELAQVVTISFQQVQDRLDAIDGRFDRADNTLSDIKSSRIVDSKLMREHSADIAELRVAVRTS